MLRHWQKKYMNKIHLHPTPNKNYMYIIKLLFYGRLYVTSKMPSFNAIPSPSFFIPHGGATCRWKRWHFALPNIPECILVTETWEQNPHTKTPKHPAPHLSRLLPVSRCHAVTPSHCILRQQPEVATSQVPARAVRVGILPAGAKSWDKEWAAVLQAVQWPLSPKIRVFVCCCFLS